MNISQTFPSFDETFPDLHRFISSLVEQYEAGKIGVWADLDALVKEFFTAERLDHLEARLPGWRKMSAYAGGTTLTHVLCAFLGLYMLPEFKRLSPEHQQLAKWVVLLHDMEKEVNPGERDLTHGFRGAVLAAKNLPGLGFAAASAYAELIEAWSAETRAAKIKPETKKDYIQDNRQLPQILSGIEALFGKDAPAAWVAKSVLLHMSVNVLVDWPQAAPLTDEQAALFITPDFRPLLKVMCLVDNEGWSMFEPDIRAQQRAETLEVFAALENGVKVS